MSLFSSLLTRVRNYAGPRELATGDSFWDGYARQSAPPPLSQTRWHLCCPIKRRNSATASSPPLPKGGTSQRVLRALTPDYRVLLFTLLVSGH
jgi:hypothetical protein